MPYDGASASSATTISPLKTSVRQLSEYAYSMVVPQPAALYYPVPQASAGILYFEWTPEADTTWGLRIQVQGRLSPLAGITVLDEFVIPQNDEVIGGVVYWSAGPYRIAYPYLAVTNIPSPAVGTASVSVYVTLVEVSL